MKSKVSKLKSAINFLVVDIARRIYFLMLEDVDSEYVDSEDAELEDVEYQKMGLTKLCLKDVK